MNKRQLRMLAILFLLFLIVNTAYLHRVPGLFGDEASEGNNVYELRAAERPPVVGERSYIGPLVDYARVPFVLLFGYSALALRMPMLLISAAAFGLALVVFRRLFSGNTYLWMMAMMFFSPTYLLYQRLGWAITLFPFFALLLLFFLTDKRMETGNRSALAGLAAGLGLHNYIVFLPTITGIVGPWLIIFRRRPKELLRYWLALLGFWAGFGTQFAVLRLMPEDQGSPGEVMSGFWERAVRLPDLLPLVLSGSAYAARYTGDEFSGLATGMITLVLIALAGIAMISKRHRRVAGLWILGLVIQLLALTFIIDRFTLRYFVLFVLGTWALAGAGLSVLARRFTWGPLCLAVLLTAATGNFVLMPYLRTGGSAERFSLGNRTDTAIDFVDTRALLDCVKKLGPVWSDNPHIYNRLQFLSRGDKEIHLPESKYEAHWLVNYRLPGEPAGVKCSELVHFRLTKRK